MNITASQVKQSCTTALLLEQQITTILKTFQAEITESSKNGLTSVQINVPTNFSLGDMNNKTAQTIIYARLIKELEEREFNVKITMSTSSVTYIISWVADSDSSDLNQMRTTIAKHLLSEEKNTTE